MEKLYQYLWRHRMLGRKLKLDNGTAVEIISPGLLNRDAGPDFSNARIRIGDTEWAGNVEIHVHASDWYRHGHDTNPVYDSVLLHVVAINDRRVTRSDGSEIPQLTATFPESFFRMYSTLCDNIEGIRCNKCISFIPPLTITDCLESLAIERMQTKASRIIDELNNSGGDWERTCFITLARALGFGLNSEPFEILARSIPLGYILRHADNLQQLEAILFGQAGMLDTSIHIFDEYYQLLCREYYFLARKYNLRPMKRELWKYARTRPQNFPHRRIAILAKALHGGFSLMSRVIAANGKTEESRAILQWELEGYWLDHSDFDITQPQSPSALGHASTDLLLINLIAPLLYAYGATHGEPELAENGLELWRKLPPEKNMFIRQWRQEGIGCEDAMRSQALLQLRKEYCDAGRCLDCRIGHWLLRHNARDIQFHENIR